MREGLVDLENFLVNELHRPLVGNDVVNGQQQPVLRVREMHHGRAKQRRPSQVERLASIVPHHAQPFRSCSGPGSERRSNSESPTSIVGATTCRGCPSRWVKAVRSTWWR